ncbi:GNAT family N-acetyltransferase [Marinitenerispora sediminis]|uniref:GNAT family N-acetyltransferase n=1 Tax=Marinitenerispora sediminis TaxID=1931232 RepID=A0A368T9Z3_9ACTN|nr:GNAT family N-acetyltransferase [Marinitenerispora sediminis]RCV52895.1 GNAT family N-acetyltransferase [Marinitenerispora sediminis]RCV60713.1 GNAT family N-acetyltransferase [Marinitenerispora sediminis]RCV61574.1 GNAT family N-acetyltransferase [Marinitenerispora sediminis]
MTSNTPYASVWRADAAERQVVVDVFTEAFMDDPVARWLFPEASERARLQQRFYRAQLAHPAAEADLAGHREGAALWLRLAAGQSPHGQHPEAPAAGPPPDFGAGGARLHALGQALARRHLGREPHLYLACMGVAAGRQGGGLGSAMLRHRLRRADADGLAAYLEASSPRSRALYQRHGFEDLGAPVRVADGPPLWPMWRPACR